MSKLDKVSNKLTNLQTITTKPLITKNSISNFDDVPAIYLPADLTPELNMYSNSYNSSIALLDDPNQLTKIANETYIHIYDKKLALLNSNFKTLIGEADDKIQNPTPIKAIKSMYNSQILNLERYPDPNITQPASQTADLSSNTSLPQNKYVGNGYTDSSKYPNYLIYLNGGCVDYNKSISTDPATWSNKSCNASLPSQQFKITQINNIQNYNDKLANTSIHKKYDNLKTTNASNSDYVSKYSINDSNSTQFGFYVVNPMDDNNQCLQLNNDGLSIMPCTMEPSQRFKPVYHSVIQ